MRFGPWYPLADAGDLAPPVEGVLQLRLAAGLLDYPTGKSAMVAYRHAPDLRACAQALARAHAGRAHAGRADAGRADAGRAADLLCRHLIEIPAATDLAAFCAKLREDFVRRFGRAPIYDP